MIKQGNQNLRSALIQGILKIKAIILVNVDFKVVIAYI
jgi:hypothetical protein